MANAYSISNILTKTYKTLNFTGKWLKAVGKPEPTGSWFIYGPPKNGKTTFALTLCKYLTLFKRVAYDSIEEGLSLTIRMAVERVGLDKVSGKMVLLDKESIEDLIKRLDRHKSPDVVVIDSVQFADLTFAQYKLLKARFPTKIFIYVSHVEGKIPEGNVAKRIWRDANVIFRIEGFRAFATSRYGGDGYIDISEEKAAEYWGLEK